MFKYNTKVLYITCRNAQGSGALLTRLNNSIFFENVRREAQGAAKTRKAQSAWRIANETPWETKEVIMDKPNIEF
jgi:hypothetical protein